MAWARENRYIVFTNDLDYGALLFATAAASPSVNQIRAEDIRPASPEHAVLFALEAAAEDLSTGALVTIDPAGCGFLRYHSGEVPLNLRKTCLAMT